MLQPFDDHDDDIRRAARRLLLPDYCGHCDTRLADVFKHDCPVLAIERREAKRLDDYDDGIIADDDR